MTNEYSGRHPRLAGVRFSALVTALETFPLRWGYYG